MWVKLANPVKTRAIAEARVETDKLDSKVLAHLLRADGLTSSLNLQVVDPQHPMVPPLINIENTIFALGSVLF